MLDLPDRTEVAKREHVIEAIEAGIARAREQYGLSDEAAEKLREVGRTTKETTIAIFCSNGHRCPLTQAGLWVPGEDDEDDCFVGINASAGIAFYDAYDYCLTQRYFAQILTIED